MIIHFSSPVGRSVNDFIDPQECTVKYSSFNEVFQMIQNMDPNALMRKWMFPMPLGYYLLNLRILVCWDLSLWAITTLITVCLWSVLYLVLYLLR